MTTKPEKTDTGPANADDDVVSDPADGSATDWSDEGGATDEGPATDADSD
jgi:hypothetical protein